MRTLLTVIALVFAVAIAHAQPAPVAPQTTVLYGYVYRTNLTAAAGAIIITERTIPLASQPFVIGQAQRRDTANAAGFISMRVLRNSIVYISAADRAGYLGIPASPGAVRITIPDADSVMLVTDTSTIAIPQTYVLARPLLTLSDGITSGAISALTITGSSVGSVTFNGASASIVLNGGAAATDYGDSIHVADSLARMRRVFISRFSAAITLDSSTDAAGRIYYTVSLDPDTVQAWLRDSSMTWMLGRVVQLADSGIAERGYMTPTQIRTLLAGYSVTGHAHAIADVTGLATALGDTASYRDRMASVEGSLAVIIDTINAVRGRLATVAADLNTHIARTDNPHAVTAAQIGAIENEADPVFTAAAPTLRSKGDTLVDVRQTHLEMPNLTHILTADSNKTICVDGSGRLYLCWKGSGAAVTIDTLQFVGRNRDNDTVRGRKVFRDTLRAVKGIKFSDGVTNFWDYRVGIWTEGSSLVFGSWGNIMLRDAGLTVGAGNSPVSILTAAWLDMRGNATSSTRYWSHPHQWNVGYVAADTKYKHWYTNNNVQSINRVLSEEDSLGNIWRLGGYSTTTGNISTVTGTVSAKTAISDSSIAGVRVIDTTRRVSAVGDSITFILTEIRAPLSPAKGRKSGYVVFDFTSELAYGYGGSGVMMHTIIADTASGVRIEAASYNTWGTRDGNPDYSFHAEQTLFWASHSKTTKATTGLAQDATWTMRTPGSTQQSRWNMRLNTTYIYQNLMAGRVTIRYTMPQGNNSISPIRVVGGWI